MVSTQLLRRYPFFAGLSLDHLALLSQVGDEHLFKPEEVIFYEGDELRQFYLVLEGTVAITIGVTDREQGNNKADQLVGVFNMKGVVVSTVNEGQIFGWSALVPPHTSTAGAEAVKPCRVVSFDCKELRPLFDKDCQFAYLMLLKAARIIRERLRDMRVESLAERVG